LILHEKKAFGPTKLMIHMGNVGEIPHYIRGGAEPVSTTEIARRGAIPNSVGFRWNYV
jgi:hypothetical protein